MTIDVRERQIEITQLNGASQVKLNQRYWPAP